MITAWGAELDLEVETFQSNHEGAIVDRIQAARGTFDGLVLNGGALTHYSYSIHDALLAAEVPAVEVHISDIHAREPWRRVSVTAPACIYSIFGRGIEGYRHALGALVRLTADPPVTSRYGDHTEQVIDLRVPAGGAERLAVTVHGGAWENIWTRDILDAIAVDLYRRGWATANIEYRRVGSGGGWPATVDDVVAAARHAAAVTGIDISEAVLVGHSAGGHLALLAARDLSPATVVPLAAITDMVTAHNHPPLRNSGKGFLGGRPTEEHAAASPLNDPPRVRHVIVHGTADETVPHRDTKAYIKRLAAEGIPFEVVPAEGIDHNQPADPAHPTWQAVAELLS